ncbi:TetR/AcrR family transcriptional regulator [Candidatus Microthrix parvicella]|jgi:DNA-binding transcriptional regulator YbjK|uniref:TetR/AcrR family transcriptional regulator n=1 Tax=Candidatus Neomicrothrix parvicella TaxID=41950 RepID=UPI0003714C28|nr:TetR/AcrR family transcriptional regulator [Candidatus Microthrix parvicella]
MAANALRREALLDAAIAVLAERGTRGLTFRAVDANAGTPVGTASNYFANRDELIAQVFEQIGVRLAPDPDEVDRLSQRTPSTELFADYMRYIVARLSAERDVTIALFELRLEASRNPRIAELVQNWVSTGFAADVAFNDGAGLPGGREQLALFHYALDGLMLDRLTAPIDPSTSTDQVIDRLVDGLLK